MCIEVVRVVWCGAISDNGTDLLRNAIFIVSVRILRYVSSIE